MFDLDLSTEQDQLRDAVGALLRRHCDPATVRNAEPAGFSADLWDQVRRLGLVEMAVPAAAGGGGAEFADLALVCEVAGAHLAPVPLVEAAVAGRLLARLDTEPARRLLGDHLSGAALTTVSLRPAAGEVVRAVPAGAVAPRVIVPVAAGLAFLEAAPPPVAPNLGCLPVADRSARDLVELATGSAPLEHYERALAEWRCLTAASLCGAGRRALEIGVDYTRERHAFGVPIGSFQSIAHRLADDATLVDGAELLSREAAWAQDHEPAQAATLASMAFVFAAETAERVASDVLHFHGGYGFMLEYDIQLYFRRVKAWSLMLGDRRREPERLADLLFGPVGEAQ